MTEESVSFNHGRGATSDRIATLAEMEHARRHCLRSAVALAQEEKDDEAFKFLVWAKQLMDMRRKYMGAWFPNVDTKHWCLCKSTACLRQLAYELGDQDLILSVDTLVDEVWEDATGEDLSECSVCREDKKEGE